jgi:phosphatidylserine decarboxylase
VRIDPAGWPFIGGALVLAALAGVAIAPWAALPLAVLAAFFVFFFRDPDRHIARQDNAVLSPADGRVLVAGTAEATAAPAGEWLQVSIFLSPMDVHVNRVPVSGRVTHVEYRRGRFLPAYHADAAATNERSEIWIDHDGRPVVARQVVGILARRVICRLQPGATVQAGDRYGIMKFGSRMDVFLPTSAEILVRPGDAVRGGETVIAVLH